MRCACQIIKKGAGNTFKMKEFNTDILHTGFLYTVHHMCESQTASQIKVILSNIL